MNKIIFETTLKFNWISTSLGIILFSFPGIICGNFLYTGSVYDEHSWLPLWGQKLFLLTFITVPILVVIFIIYGSIRRFKHPIKITMNDDSFIAPISLFDTKEFPYSEISLIQSYKDIRWNGIKFCNQKRCYQLTDFSFQSPDDFSTFTKILIKKTNLKIGEANIF